MDRNYDIKAEIGCIQMQSSAKLILCNSSSAFFASKIRAQQNEPFIFYDYLVELVENVKKSTKIYNARVFFFNEQSFAQFCYFT